MNTEDLSQAMRRIVGRSPILPEKHLKVLIIANPRSGGFTRPRIWSQHRANLAALVAEAEKLPARQGELHLELLPTERPGHAMDLAREALSAHEAEADPHTALILVSAGGDGTSWEVQTALMEYPQALRDRVLLLRLPMGTGNDGSDGWDLDAALGRLVRPARAELRRAIRISIPGVDRQRYAFNIASIGLDAYVTSMTNKLKGVFPGDSYRLWVDVSSVMYDKTFKVDSMRVDMEREDGTSESVVAPFLLAAMGVTGRRTYGSHLPILPDDDNFVAIRQMGFLRKLAFKAKAMTGAHKGMPEAVFRNVRRLRFSYDRKILMQFDGEVLALGPENFPFTMELTEPAIRTLSYS